MVERNRYEYVRHYMSLGHSREMAQILSSNEVDRQEVRSQIAKGYREQMDNWGYDDSPPPPGHVIGGF